MAEKAILKYYFSVEGETEKWYLEYLAALINQTDKSLYKVVFNTKVCNPSSFVKRVSFLQDIQIHHFFDVESTEPEYEKRFINTLDNMKVAETLGKAVQYFPVYSNLSFELWMIRHKIDYNGSVSDRKNYLLGINKAFNLSYQGLKEYKEEKHFKQVLNQISLVDVKEAIRRANKIMQDNKNRGYKLKVHHKYSWYEENPSTEVGLIIGKILLDCGI